jgi:hypothetical protein
MPAPKPPSQRRLTGLEQPRAEAPYIHFLFVAAGEGEAEFERERKRLIAAGRARARDRFIAFRWKDAPR